MSRTALERLIETDKNLREFGFDWPDLEMIFQKIKSELEEVKEAEGKNHLQEEIGDLLHTVVSLCIFVGFDVEETIRKARDKLEARADALKVVAEEKGHDSLKGQSVEYMLELWREAKKIA